MTVLAVQIGMEGFAVCRVADDVEEGDIRKAPVPTGDAAWEVCRELLLDTAGGEEVLGVGIACSGPIDMASGVVAPVEVPQWRTGFALGDAVRKLFPTAEVQIALDGVCHGLAERNFGATAEVMDALTIMASHHISAGVSVGGLVVVGRTGNAGHFGHMLVPGFDDQCECGGCGCLVAVAGGTALLRWAGQQGSAADSIEALVHAAQSGDSVAVAALERAGTALGRAIASAAPLLDFELVVVGGPLSKGGPALWKPLRAAVATHARLGFLTGLRVVASEIDDLAVLIGAGVLGVMASGAGQG